ncbi:hypothetical protein GCM10010193_58330 [Kitasatospora atroaurantiaca]|uniref:Ribosomal protein S18 acetylase RimI-like enzyme n=1 Tax=Kitasatospora atroaurantiaca TaxID=285545 RepID=A0A561EP57_9ACTN|nr:GNAT family N-acetyltransferase [Kitasatospora atroaurantiaca]TWE17396.1 ribosomal protein S18 acetylase RimI-like enzyme [Kitasatospora atroaurantiaca]
MEMRSRLEQANDNAAAFWLGQARVHGWEHIRSAGYTAVRCARDAADAHRVVITRPYGEAGELVAELTELFRTWGTVQLCLEDPYGGLDLARFGREASLQMAVMAREPEDASGLGISDRTAAGLTVDEVRDDEDLAAVERAVVEGFPVAARQPWVRGELLPPGLLTLPGYRAWLGRVDGRPAGGCMTYDDGETVGVYWVATLPEHRSQGIARAAVAEALAAHPGRVTTLVATLLGEPLYRRLGFTEQGVTRWWR